MYPPGCTPGDIFTHRNQLGDKLVKCTVVSSRWHPVSSEYEVEVLLTEEESSELRKALSVVQKYQRAAAIATNSRVDGKDSTCDWVMFGYAVKRDRVVVTVKAGAAG